MPVANSRIAGTIFLRKQTKGLFFVLIDKLFRLVEINSQIENERFPKGIWLLLAILLLLRLIFIAFMGLMPQDAYYQFYGDHLALSYFDHPPMIAYMLRLATSLFGKNVFALKLMDSLVSALSLYFFYQLALRFLSRHKARIAVLLYFSSLMLSVLSLVSTPDTPLMLFWILSVLFLHKALQYKRQIDWILSGIAMGLSFDSKYTGLMLPGGLILFLTINAFRGKKIPIAGALICLMVFIFTISPVLIWNAKNQFASFRFQSYNRIDAISTLHFDPLGFLGLIGHQSALLMPILFFGLLVFLWKTGRKYGILKLAEMPERNLFLLSFFLPIFIGFMLISPFYWVKLNWMMPCYITGVIWISRYFSGRWARNQLLFSLVVHAALAIEILFYPVIIRSDDTWVGWKALAAKIDTLKKTRRNDFIFSSDDYKTSAVLNFYLPEMVYSQNIVGKPALQFDYIGSDLDQLNGKNAIFVNSNPGFDDDRMEEQPPFLSNYFDSVVALKPLLIYKEGRAVRKFSIYECFRYTHNGKVLASNLPRLQ